MVHLTAARSTMMITQYVNKENQITENIMTIENQERTREFNREIKKDIRVKSIKKIVAGKKVLRLEKLTRKDV